MKQIWVDPPSEADYTKLRAWDVTDPFYDIRWDRLDLAYLQEVRSKGFNPGLYICSQGEGWPDAHSTAPAAWADWAYGEVKRIAPRTSGNFPMICINAETHDDQWLLAMFKRWRSHSPKRWTSWSMEGHQGGWMVANPAFVSGMNALNLDAYCPQAYRGGMVRMESDRVALDMVLAGFPASKVFCFYDAAQVGYWYDGVLYTQGRLQ